MNGTSGHNLRSKGKIADVETSSSARRPAAKASESSVPAATAPAAISKANFPHIRQVGRLECLWCTLCRIQCHVPLSRLRAALSGCGKCGFPPFFCRLFPQSALQTNIDRLAFA